MESETGANEEWSPIRDGGDHAGATVSVLTRAEGENGALLGLARGMIVPLVKDDLSMVGGSLFVTVLPPPPIEAAKPRTPSKQTPLRKTPSSSTLLSIAAAGDAPKRSASQPPQSWANNAKPLSKSSKAPHENKGIVSSRGARLPASRPPQKVLPVPGGKVETANSTAAAQSFLAGLQAKGPVSKQDGNDLVFTFSDDSEDEASAGESLQSEMERVRKQLQKLESGRNVRERSVPAEESESRSNGGRPESGGSKAGPLSRFAGRLGPLKGVSTVGAKGVLVSVTGGLKPGSKDPPTNIVAKAVSVETALEEMRRKVASMEQEMKQTGKPGRPATPPVGQKRKAVVQPVGGKEDKKRPAQGIAQKAGIDGRALGVFARLGEVKAAPVGAVPSAKASGVLDSRKGGLVEKGLKSLRAPQEKETVPSGNGPSAQEGPGVGGSKIKAEKGSTNTTYKQEPETSHGPAAAPSGKPSVTLTSQEGTQGTRPGSAPTPLRDKPLEGSAAQPGRTSPSKRKSSPSDYSHPPLKQPKLENELPETALRTAHNGATLQEASLASSATESTLQGVPKSGELDSSAPVVASSPLLTTAELPAEAGALVPLALGVTSAEPGVTSAELQLAALAQDEERCWAALREGEKEAAEKKSKLEDLQRALAEAERAEREAREQVLVTRERLEANRRLRVELELRDRMEKRLRAMLERGQREEIHTGGLVARDGGLQIEDSVRGDGLEAAELREGSGGASLGAGPGIAAGGDGAVWMHEAHEGGYVVSQLEEHETGEPPSGRVEGTRGTAVRAGGVSEVVLEKEGAAAQGGDVLVKELIAVETGKDLAGGDDSARRASPETAGTPAAVQSSGGRTPQRDIPGGLMVKEQLNGASVPVVESPRQGSDGQKATGGDGETAHGVSVAEGRSFRANVPVRDGVSRPSQVCKQAPGESVPRQAGERSNELAENAVGPSDANVPPSTGEKSPKESEFRPVVDLQADSQRQVEGLRVQAASAETHSPVESAQPAAESGAHCEQVAEEGGRARGQEVGRKRPPESDGARMGGASGSRRVPVHSSVKAEGRLPKRPRVEEEEGSSEGEGWSGVALEDEILRKDTILTPDAASQLPPKSHLQLGSSALLEVDPTPSPDATTSSPSHHRSAKSRGASPHSKPPPRSNIPDTPDLPRTLEAPQSAKASRSPDSQQFPRPLATPRPPDPLQASWPATPELPSPLKAAQSAKAPKPPARQQTPNPSTTPQPPDPFQTNGPATPEVSSPLKAAQPAKAPKSLDPQPNPKPSRPPNPPNLLKERLCTLLAETAAPGGAFTGALTAFRSFRLTPRYGMVWGRKFESLTWSNAVLPNWPLCATEVLSGRCSEKGCEYQHAREYVLKEEGLLAQLRGYGKATVSLRRRDPNGRVTTLEERAAQAVDELGRKGITAPLLVEPALKKWNEAPIPIYRVGHYLMDHRERPLPSGRGFSTPRAVASPVLSPGLVRPIPAGMPFIGELEREDDGATPVGWRYWERVGAGENGDGEKGNESWEAALQRALDVIDNNLETRNVEKLDQALAILARALEENRQVPCLWAVYLELFIRRAKDDQEAVEMMEAAVRFNPSSYTLWVFYLNTRATLKDKLRICQRARSSITSFLTKRVKGDNGSINHSSALLDLTLRQLYLQSEEGDQQAVIAEVQSLLAQASAEAPSPSHNGAEPQVEKAGRVFLSSLTPTDSVVFWVSCAHLLAYGALPPCTASRLGFAQVLVSPEEMWQAQPGLEMIRGSEVAVLHVFQVAANDFSVRASESKAGTDDATQAWRLGLHSLASHSVCVTALILGVDQALAVCDQLLEVYPGHTDLAYRRATMLLRTEFASGQNGRSQKKTDGEVSEALKCLVSIAESLNGSESATEAENEQYLAVLRSAELLREWQSDDAALRCLRRTLPEPPTDCLEALCCWALKAFLEGDQDRINELARSLETLAQSREHIRLVAEQRAVYAADVTSEEALCALTSLLSRGSGGPRWPALELRPLAPPWDDVTSEGLREQLRHAWWNKTAWDYSLVNQVITAWLPELRSLLDGSGGEVPPQRIEELVAALECLLRATPGNVALSSASGKLWQKSRDDKPAIGAELFNTWSIPLVFEALILAQPRAESGLWDGLAKRCREAGEERAAEELWSLAMRLKGL